MRVYVTVLAIIITVTLAAAQTAPKMFDTLDYPIRVTTIAEGLKLPYSIAILPDRSILVTQMNGQLRLIRNGALAPAPIGSIPGAYVREQSGPGGAGLMDIALHPRFAENRWVYLTYNKETADGPTMALARGTFDGAQLTDVKDLFVADAAVKQDGNLTARIAFAKDGLLYMTVSFRNQDAFSQNLNNHGGKVLRLRDDGTAAPGNPFADKPGHRPEIFSYGHRGIHGIAVHPETGDVWIAEHGDEVNILKAGANYGWPFFGIMGAGGGTPTPPAPRGLQVMGPYLSWNPVLNLSGLTFYTGNRFPKWKGNIFLGGNSTQQIHRVGFGKSTPTLDAPLFTQVREALFTGIGQGVRDVREGPDGLIYFTAYDDNTGSVRRIEPAP